jgi:16S rRNA (cytosine1402-N4)-methyltransferase
MYHIPVLLDEVIESIPIHSENIVDGTLGHAGHTIAIAEKFPHAQIIGIDLDPHIFIKAQKRSENYQNITLINDSYDHIIRIMQEQKIKSVDYILLDIGVNLEHFTNTTRGFSIHNNAPLDMRFNTEQDQTAADIIANYTPIQLSQIFQDYGDFTATKADEIARHIDQSRRKNRITDTQALRKILSECWLGKPASTVIFQAIRIETNHELAKLKKFLHVFDEILNHKGRLAIISYHSIEDKIVKQHFAQAVASGKYIAISKKVIKPSRQEIQRNRSARSAKLRIIEKI